MTQSLSLRFLAGGAVTMAGVAIITLVRRKA